MLVVSLEGTYVLETDDRGRSVERPCCLGRSSAGSIRTERGDLLGTATSAIRVAGMAPVRRGEGA